MARRRRESSEAETPEGLVDTAGQATLDTITVARRGIRATSHHETALLNLLQGFLFAFAIARTVGWVAHWQEMVSEPAMRIGRPRQLYTGALPREYADIANRR